MSKSFSPGVRVMIVAVRMARKILEILEGQIPADEWADYEEQLERAERHVAFAALSDKPEDA